MNSITFPAALGLLFIALKLTGFICWCWLWVLAPFWVPLAVVLAVLACLFAFSALASLLATVYYFLGRCRK